jgi:hypothetical protein
MKTGRFQGRVGQADFISISRFAQLSSGHLMSTATRQASALPPHLHRLQRLGGRRPLPARRARCAQVPAQRVILPHPAHLGYRLEIRQRLPWSTSQQQCRRHALAAGHGI